MFERQVAFTYLALVAFGIFGWTVLRFASVLLLGRAPRRPFREWMGRLGDVVTYFFLQRTVARESLSWHHLPIFWGFLIITAGTGEIIANGIVPGFSFALLGDSFNSAFKAVLDVTNGLVLFSVFYAVYRRTVKKPKLIPMNWDAGVILGMIALLCISHFMTHGLQHVAEVGTALAAQPVPFGPPGTIHSMPLASLAAGIFSGLGPESAHTLSGVNYWIHVLIIFFFLNYIPYSKHIHLLGALPNILLRNRGQAGVMPKLDLEDDTAWGAGRYEQLDWKSLLDSYACTECARCSNACPAMATDKPLSPMHLVLDLKDEMQERGDRLLQLSAAGRKAALSMEPESFAAELTPTDRIQLEELQNMPPLIGGRIKEETLWACTTCGACETACPVFIEHPLKILEMRTNLVLEQGKQPAEWARMFRGIENNQNPWGIGADQRLDWARGLDVPVMADKGTAEYLVWIGCAGSFDDRGKKIARDWVSLLTQAGVDYAVLGTEEGCTGDSARRAGNEFLFQTMVEGNLELFKKYNVQKILTTCPHCFHSFQNEYPQFGGNFEVWHHTQFLDKLLAEGKLKPSQPVQEEVAFHDPCYLGRWNQEYDAPRAVLTAAGGKAPTEMPRHHQKSFCCGAGGARLWAEEEEPRININRTEEAVATGAKVVATACPFCNVMLDDGVKHLNKDEQVEVLDIAQLLARATGATQASNPVEPT